MGSTRRQRESEMARSIITESAARIFAQRGFHGATMDAIAREANYSPAALYKYFRNKREIFLTVLDTLGNEFLSVFEAPVPPGLSFEHRLRWVLYQLSAVLTKYQDFYVAFVAERGKFSHELATELDAEDELRSEENHSEFQRRISDLMEEGRRSGELSRDLEAPDYAAAFMGICNGFFFRWLETDQKQGLEAHIETIVNLFLHGASSTATENSDDK